MFEPRASDSSAYVLPPPTLSSHRSGQQDRLALRPAKSGPAGLFWHTLVGANPSRRRHELFCLRPLALGIISSAAEPDLQHSAFCLQLLSECRLPTFWHAGNSAAKIAIELLVDLPVVLPPSVAGLALLLAFGRTGLFGKWLALVGVSLPFTTAAVVLAQTFVGAPLFVRSARLGFAEIDPRLEEAAWVEGGNEWQVFRYIMFPLAWRGLLPGVILAWARALGEFGATILFSGNLEGKTQTMPLAIYLGLERGLGMALALSVLLVVVSVVLLGVLRSVEKSGGR